MRPFVFFYVFLRGNRMIIAFCGHATYIQNSEDEKKVLEILELRLGDAPSEFFLGEYGSFDRFAYNCAKKFKEKHSNTKLIFVTPYLRVEGKNDRFDGILYPELERIPPRYAISHRNRWIVEQADIIIAYVAHAYGGAYAMYRYAKHKGKEIYNIAEIK